jgi:hypothetical protein
LTDSFERTYLGLATFLLGVTLCGLLLAELRIFNAYLAAGGGLAGGGSFLYLTRTLPAPASRSGWAPFIFLTCLVGHASLLYLPPFNWILGSLDPGGYVNTAAQLSTTGALLIKDPLVSAAAQAGPATSVFFPWGNLGYLPGYYLYKGVIVPQFYHTFPVVLAFINSLFGLRAALHLAPTLALLNGFGFFLLVRRWLGGTLGPILAVVVLVSNVSFVWFARLANSEMLALQFLLAGLLAMNLGEQSKMPGSSRGWGALSAGFLGGAFLTRVDMIYLFPALILGWLMFIWRDKFRLALTWALTLGAFILWTFMHAYFFSFPYFYAGFDRTGVLPFLRKHSVFFLVAGLAFLGVLLALTWILKSDSPVRQAIAPWIERGPALLLPAAILLFAGSTVCYYFFHWEILTWLAWYCGVPALALSVVGLISWAKGAARGSDVPVSLAIFLLTALTTTMVLGPNPKVDPVHFWASRRLLVFVFPMVSLFVARGLLEAFQWMGKTGGVALLAISVIPGVYNIAPIVGFQMFKGANKDLERFAQQIPNNAVVIYYGAEHLALIATPLRFLYQKSILPVRDDAVPASAIDWLKRNFPDRPILVGTLAQRFPHLSWPYVLSPQPLASVPIKWSIFASKITELPRTTGSVQGDLELWQVGVGNAEKPFRASAAELELLGARINGFYFVERGRGDRRFRWTNGQAELVIDRGFVKDSRMLHVELDDNRLQPVETEIFLNSQRLGAVPVERGRVTTFSYRLPANWLQESENARIELRTPTWSPAEVYGSKDTRKLGVMLLEVRFEK